MIRQLFHMSYRGAALAVVAVLAGCAGQATEFHRYTLPLADQRQAEPGVSLPDSAPTVAVSSVRLADYLDGQGVVYQTSDIEVNEAQTNLWADSLSAQLTRSLQRTLGDQLRDHRVLGETLAGDRADTGVRVTLSRFQGRHDGMAVLAGQYQLRDAGGNLLAQHHFDIERALENDGYPALVRLAGLGERGRADCRRDHPPGADRHDGDAFIKSLTGSVSAGRGALRRCPACLSVRRKARRHGGPFLWSTSGFQRLIASDQGDSGIHQSLVCRAWSPYSAASALKASSSCISSCQGGLSSKSPEP